MEYRNKIEACLEFGCACRGNSIRTPVRWTNSAVASTAPKIDTTMASPSNILDPAALISSLPNILPADSKRLSSAQDGLAALLHIVFTALGFRLTEVNGSSVTPGNDFPPQWNQNGPGDYSFKYRHDQSSLEFIVKISKLGSRTVINAIALEVRWAVLMCQNRGSLILSFRPIK